MFWPSSIPPAPRIQIPLSEHGNDSAKAFHVWCCRVASPIKVRGSLYSPVEVRMLRCQTLSHIDTLGICHSSSPTRSLSASAPLRRSWLPLARVPAGTRRQRLYSCPSRRRTSLAISVDQNSVYQTRERFRERELGSLRARYSLIHLPAFPVHLATARTLSVRCQH